MPLRPRHCKPCWTKWSLLSQDHGLEISTKKTKVMVIAQEVPTTPRFTCNGERLVDSFRYLGANINLAGDCSADVRVRLGTARSTVASLASLLKDRSLSTEMKQRLMRTLVWPIATYGCESWTLKGIDKKRISAFEMTAYRRSYESAGESIDRTSLSCSSWTHQHDYVVMSSGESYSFSATL